MKLNPGRRNNRRNKMPKPRPVLGAADAKQDVSAADDITPQEKPAGTVANRLAGAMKSNKGKAAGASLNQQQLQGRFRVYCRVRPMTLKEKRKGYHQVIDASGK